MRNVAYLRDALVPCFETLESKLHQLFEGWVNSECHEIRTMWECSEIWKTDVIPRWQVKFLTPINLPSVFDFSLRNPEDNCQPGGGDMWQQIHSLSLSLHALDYTQAYDALSYAQAPKSMRWLSSHVRHPVRRYPLTTAAHAGMKCTNIQPPGRTDSE